MACAAHGPWCFGTDADPEGMLTGQGASEWAAYISGVSSRVGAVAVQGAGRTGLLAAVGADGDESRRPSPSDATSACG